MRTQPLRFISVLILLLLLPGTAGSQLVFTFAQPVASGIAGATVTFSGTLTNTSEAPLFLNSDSSSLAGIALTLDDSPFLFNAPTMLQPTGDPSGNDRWAGDLFNVQIGATAMPGDYIGSFTILGGADSNATNVLATQNFVVTVQPNAVPEPGAFLIALFAIATIGALALRRNDRNLPISMRQFGTTILAHSDRCNCHRLNRGLVIDLQTPLTHCFDVSHQGEEP